MWFLKNKSMLSMVKEFHERFDHPIACEDTLEILSMRTRLIREEVKELLIELDKMIMLTEAGFKDSLEYSQAKENSLKELCDVVYVLLGSVVSLKYLKNFKKAFKSVHQANMTKSFEKDDSGKTKKGSTYKKPNMGDFIE